VAKIVRMSARLHSPLSIVVCLKPVQVPSARMRLDESARATHPGDAPFAVNPADLAALGLALSLDSGGTTVAVTALTVGPEFWEEPLRVALAAGARQALRVWNGEWPSERWQGAQDGSAAHTAFAARAAAEALTAHVPDLVFTGESSLDSGHACFGAFLARFLGATYAHRTVALNRDDAGWRTRVKLERGYTQEMVLPEPAVLSVSAGLPQPPYPSLPAWIAARAEAIPLRSSPLRYPALPATALHPPHPRVKRFTVPGSTLDAESRIRAMVEQPMAGGGTILQAGESAATQAEAIVKLLREKGYWGAG
jgi:electron transfer flavoprotein beta subunit